MSKWWNILPDTECVLAIDAESQILDNGRTLTFSNDPSKTYTMFENVEQSMSIEEVTAPRLKNFSPTPETLIYRCVTFNKIHLRTATPLVVPDNCTVVLVCRPTSDFAPLGSGSTRAIMIGDVSRFYLTAHRLWTTADTALSVHEPFSRRFSESKKANYLHNFDTLVVRGNKFTKRAELITSYGTYTESNSQLLTLTNIPELGHRRTSAWGNDNDWALRGSIVALGVFDKQLSEEEIETVLAKIDEQFLIKRSKWVESPINNIHIFPRTLGNIPTPQGFKLQSMYREIPEAIVTTDPASVKNMSVRDYSSLSDFIYEEEEPIATKVFLIDRVSGKHIATTYSDSTGFFEFKNIERDKEYLVVAPHLNYQHRAIAKDYLKEDR